MNMFANVTSDGLEDAVDRLGGGGVLETGGYPATVKLAYAGKSNSSNAQSVVVHLDIGGMEVRESLWVMNKNGQNFYQDKNDATKRQPLPGFTTADDLCLLITGQPLSSTNIEEKIVSLYDFEARKDLPQNVPVLIDLIGKQVTVGLVKQNVDKTAKQPDGSYAPTGETRDENTIDKFYHDPSLRTVSEVKAGIEEAAFYQKWVAKNEGKTRMRAKGAEGNTGAPGRPAAAPGAAPAPAKSLFAV